MRAAAHFERASEAGYPSAIYEFGLALFHGKGVPSDVPCGVPDPRFGAGWE
jgi:TPR repeat protein